LHSLPKKKMSTLTLNQQKDVIRFSRSVRAVAYALAQRHKSRKALSFGMIADLLKKASNMLSALLKVPPMLLKKAMQGVGLVLRSLRRMLGIKKPFGFEVWIRAQLNYHENPDAALLRRMVAAAIVEIKVAWKTHEDKRSTYRVLDKMLSVLSQASLLSKREGGAVKVRELLRPTWIELQGTIALLPQSIQDSLKTSLPKDEDVLAASSLEDLLSLKETFFEIKKGFQRLELSFDLFGAFKSLVAAPLRLIKFGKNKLFAFAKAAPGLFLKAINALFGAIQRNPKIITGVLLLAGSLVGARFFVDFLLMLPQAFRLAGFGFGLTGLIGAWSAGTTQLLEGWYELSDRRNQEAEDAAEAKKDEIRSRLDALIAKKAREAKALVEKMMADYKAANNGSLEGFKVEIAPDSEFCKAVDLRSRLSFGLFDSLKKVVSMPVSTMKSLSRKAQTAICRWLLGAIDFVLRNLTSVSGIVKYGTLLTIAQAAFRLGQIVKVVGPAKLLFGAGTIVLFFNFISDLQSWHYSGGDWSQLFPKIKQKIYGYLVKIRKQISRFAAYRELRVSFALLHKTKQKIRFALSQKKRGVVSFGMLESIKSKIVQAIKVLGRVPEVLFKKSVALLSSLFAGFRKLLGFSKPTTFEDGARKLLTDRSKPDSDKISKLREFMINSARSAIEDLENIASKESGFFRTLKYFGSKVSVVALNKRPESIFSDIVTLEKEARRLAPLFTKYKDRPFVKRIEHAWGVLIGMITRFASGQQIDPLRFKLAAEEFNSVIGKTKASLSFGLLDSLKSAWGVLRSGASKAFEWIKSAPKKLAFFLWGLLEKIRKAMLAFQTDSTIQRLGSRILLLKLVQTVANLLGRISPALKTVTWGVAIAANLQPVVNFLAAFVMWLKNGYRENQANELARIGDQFSKVSHKVRSQLLLLTREKDARDASEISFALPRKLLRYPELCFALSLYRTVRKQKRSLSFGLFDSIKAIWNKFVAFLKSGWQKALKTGGMVWKGVKTLFLASLRPIKAAWKKIFGDTKKLDKLEKEFKDAKDSKDERDIQKAATEVVQETIKEEKGLKTELKALHDKMASDWDTAYNRVMKKIGEGVGMLASESTDDHSPKKTMMSEVDAQVGTSRFDIARLKDIAGKPFAKLLGDEYDSPECAVLLRMIDGIVGGSSNYKKSSVFEVTEPLRQADAYVKKTLLPAVLKLQPKN